MLQLWILVLFIKKKDRSLYLCINNQRLNKITYKDHYLIPLVSNLLDASKKVRIYSEIDLHSAYYLVRIVEDNEWKTTFHTQYSFYKWLVMPFGLSNTPSVFQWLVDGIFSDLLDMCIVI